MVPLGTVAGAVAPGAGSIQRLHAGDVPWGSHWGGDSEAWVNPVPVTGVVTPAALPKIRKNPEGSPLPMEVLLEPPGQ